MSSKFDTDDDLGEGYLYMHLSALSPTTRKSHAERHGKLFTAQEVREFWSDPTNVDGCKCTVTAMMVDDDGKPLVPSIVKQARDAYEKMRTRGYDWSK
ncbi:MAG: hypothetical protein ABN482_10475 [Corticimicrobacter sp.]|uniref:hypothetical protein n=1 Tax=Corticimicrobacter sp. TaxID=2678536 RepID=UPI0032DAAA00